MKIAAILPTLDVYGGVRRYIEIGNELTKRGHQYILFVHTDNVPLPKHPNWINCDFEIFGAQWITDERFKKFNFDVVIASECGFEYFIKVDAMKRIYYSISDKVNEVALSVADMVAVNSTRQMILMRNKGLDALDWIGGINLDQFCPIGVPKNLPPQITLYGKWSENKATGYIVRAIEIVAKKHELLFTPYGMKEQVYGRCPTNADKYFQLEGSRIAEAYQQSMLTVAIELSAGWCNGAAESMACGTPVVCGKVGTVDFAIDKETALVVPEKDIHSIARAITVLLEDKVLYDKLSKNGRNKIREFSWQKVVDKIEETLL